MCKLSVILACIGLLSAFAAMAADGARVSQCYSCRGITCLRTTAQNATETCVSSEDDCVTIFSKFTVVAKGCLLTMPIELRQKCSDISSLECQVCNGPMCNSLGRSDFKCYQCSGKDDLNCTHNLTALEPVQCKAPTTTNSYCFTDLTHDGYVRRGCCLHVKEQKECLASENCSLCSVENGEGCNNLPKDNDMHGSGTAPSGLVGLVAICAAVLFRL